MTNTVIARRYANAVFALGKKGGDAALSQHGVCLSGLEGMLVAVPALEIMLKSPVISVDEKKAVLGKLLDTMKADAVVRNFCFLLADHGRLAFLRDIANCYGILLDKAKGIVRGRLTTAVSLAAEKQAKFKNQLEKKTGSGIELTFAVDKNILGGMILKIGDRVLDASLRAQLGILRETFKRGE